MYRFPWRRIFNRRYIYPSFLAFRHLILFQNIWPGLHSCKICWLCCGIFVFSFRRETCNWLSMCQCDIQAIRRLSILVRTLLCIYFVVVEEQALSRSYAHQMQARITTDVFLSDLFRPLAHLSSLFQLFTPDHYLSTSPVILTSCYSLCEITIRNSFMGQVSRAPFSLLYNTSHQESASM